MSKYIDLTKQISEDQERGTLDPEIVRRTLDYLDDHTEQVPGRTITESQLKDWTSHMTMAGLGGFDEAMDRLNITVVPDPEPTNAERLHELIDYGECPWRRGPDAIATFLDRHGVTAPGGDDEG